MMIADAMSAKPIPAATAMKMAIGRYSFSNSGIRTASWAALKRPFSLAPS
jgi:hypothetical protein